MDSSVVYACHPQHCLKYNLPLSKYEAHVVAEVLGAGAIDMLPFLPTVYQEDDEPEAERTRKERSCGATPLKTTVDAAMLASGGINSVDYSGGGGAVVSGGSGGADRAPSG